MDKAIIETDRLIIRLLNLSDVEMILALLNEPSFLSNIGDKGAISQRLFVLSVNCQAELHLFRLFFVRKHIHVFCKAP